MTTNVLDKILAVFDSVSDWLVTAMGNIEPLFYADGNLTFLGVLAIAGLIPSHFCMLPAYRHRSEIPALRRLITSGDASASPFTIERSTYVL